MADHLGQERRRYPRVTVPSAAQSMAALIPLLQEEERSTSATQLAVPESNVKAAVALSQPMLRLVAQAGLSLAVWGGATFVAVRLAMIGASWVTGRSGDALTT
jgi:hypothetical protein